MSEDKGNKYLELEDLLFNTGKQALKIITTDCIFCDGSKEVVEEIIVDGRIIQNLKPCPRCCKEKK